MSEKLWAGRFKEKTAKIVETFTSSIDVDRQLYAYDIQGSIAHCRTLAKADIISAKEAEELIAGLEKVKQEIEEGTLPYSDALEDIHTHIESRLAEIVGKVAHKLHTARSRNDQVALDVRLYLRDTVDSIIQHLFQLQNVLVDLAGRHIETVLPGYTHLQRAQPVRLAHHWLAFAEMLGRDASRQRSLRSRLSDCPLGSGALAGSTLPLDRQHTAAALGFDAPSANSMDAVASRDVALEFLATAAICMIQLSRLAEELVLWSTAEFGFVELSDAYSTGSSLMPQKKNPDVPELVRGKSGRAIGNLVTLLSVMKALPLTYNRDMQEDKEPIFDSAITLRDSLEVMAGAIQTLRVNTERMAAAADDAMLLATDLAEALVLAGVPFREAHEAVGQIVRHCIGKELDLRSLTREDLQAFHAGFPASAAEIASLEGALEGRKVIGGTARGTVEKALSIARADNARRLGELSNGEIR